MNNVPVSLMITASIMSLIIAISCFVGGEIYFGIAWVLVLAALLTTSPRRRKNGHRS